MWEMYNTDNECDKCGGPGPPPKFTIPPPPRPPYLMQNQQDISKCIEIDRLDMDMCEAIPILDASYHSSPSLQTSAMIAVFSLLLVLVVLISSLFVWKHKRKVQNFLPCKTPSRGSHLNGGVSGGHSVTYEDPDAHLGHRPLVVRHHHNVEMLPSKTIHYPSGYPIAKSPPLFVCSSPGPDPYRSNDNVYEELGPGRDSGGESDPPLNSDDDFAEDELSLPGDGSFNKTPSEIATIPVPTIYHERINASNIGGQERSSLISSSSSTANNDQRTGLLSGVIRQATNSCGRRTTHHHNSISNSNSNSKSNNNNSSCSSNKNSNRKTSNISVGDINTFNQSGTDIVPPVYDERNLMTLPLNSHHHHHPHHQNHHQLNNINNTFSYSNCNSNISNNVTNNRLQCLATSTPGLLIESEVERRNRINNQLHHPPVSTVFRDRVNYGAGNGGVGGGGAGGSVGVGVGINNHPQPYYSHHNLLGSQRLRTNPRSLDRRRIGVPIEYETTYGYAEPVFHEGLLYDACIAHTNTTNTNSLRNPTYPYMLPEFTSFRTLGNTPHHHIQQQQQQHQQHQQQQLTPSSQHPQSEIYSRDSSFGSDSGYSHHTQTSGRGGGGGGGGVAGGNSINSVGSNGCGRHNSNVNSSNNSNSNNSNNAVGKLASLSFSWSRSGNKGNSLKNSNNSNTNKHSTQTSFEQS